MILGFSIGSLLCALMPAVLTARNLREYQPPLEPEGELLGVTVIIPARNEAAGIGACMDAVLRSSDCNLDLLVLDDASTDKTPAIIESYAQRDARVRLLQGGRLPVGWNGKQYACFQAAGEAQSPILLFLDADVRLEPGAVARMAAYLEREQAALVSGFPRQITETWLEQLLIPLIHFVLLGLLPMEMLRTTTQPGFAAGCGQFLMVRRDAYFASGAHAAIRHTMHDGLLLPRLLREHGHGTRLADLTELATCRMYTSTASVWEGLAKNATEGLAAPARIVPMSLLLGMGQVLPLPLMVVALAKRQWVSAMVAGAALALSYAPRVLEAPRFRQSRRSAAAHPVGVAVLLALQWYALGRKLLRRPATWKDRAYAAN